MPVIRRMDREMAVYSYSGIVQLLSRVQFFATPWAAACQAPLSSTVFRSLLKFMSTEPVLLSNHLSRLFTSGGQSIGASATILPMKIQG